ncbi:MAG: Cytochrome biosis protein [Pseudomonadota bacterium]|jgi:cytochrome c-type biogenesis protein CcmH/NrfF
MCSSVSKTLIALCVALIVGSAQADERSEALDREATNLYQQVFSPFCPGRSLNDCPSSKAAELKDQMRAELEAGKAPEVILNEVFQKFGDQYRAVPQFSGVGMLVWIVPVAFVVIGLIVAVGASIRRRKGNTTASGATPPDLSAEEERRIQEELSRLE